MPRIQEMDALMLKLQGEAHEEDDWEKAAKAQVDNDADSDGEEMQDTQRLEMQLVDLKEPSAQLISEAVSRARVHPLYREAIAQGDNARKKVEQLREAAMIRGGGDFAGFWSCRSVTSCSPSTISRG